MGATTSGGSPKPLPLRFQNPAQHRIGWHRDSLVYLAVVALGYLIGLVGPALVVPPGLDTAPKRDIAIAFSITVLGVVIAVVAATLAYRRRHNWSWMVIGIAPSMSLLLGGAILAATKANAI